eukprot:sb/3467251/
MSETETFHGFLVYHSFCSRKEIEFRTSNRLRSPWEQNTLFAQFTRTGKACIRSPEWLLKSTNELLKLLHCDENEELSPDLFNFLGDRLASVKQEFVMGELNAGHISILISIAKFFLFAITRVPGEQHKAFSEAYSTVCLAYKTWLTSPGCDLSNIDNELLIYYYLMNVESVVEFDTLLKQRGISCPHVRRLLDIFRVIQSGNYHRFRVLWDHDLNLLEKAALTESVFGLSRRAQTVISTAFKSKKLSYPIGKFQKYTFVTSVGDLNISNERITFSDKIVTDKNLSLWDDVSFIVPSFFVKDCK